MAAIAHGVGALLFVDMAHIAGLVAAGVHPSPFPHADIVTTTTHKTLRGPRGGLIFSRRELPPEVDPADFPTVKGNLAATVDKTVFPGVQGGPLMHVIAGKAVAFRLAPRRSSAGISGGRSRTPPTIAETLAGAAPGSSRGGTDNHLMLVDVMPLGVTGKEAEHAPRRDRHHRQQEPDPVRSAARRTRRPGSGSAPRRSRRVAWAPPRCA